MRSTIARYEGGAQSRRRTYFFLLIFFFFAVFFFALFFFAGFALSGSRFESLPESESVRPRRSASFFGSFPAFSTYLAELALDRGSWSPKAEPVKPETR